MLSVVPSEDLLARGGSEVLDLGFKGLGPLGQKPTGFEGKLVVLRNKAVTYGLIYCMGLMV